MSTADLFNPRPTDRAGPAERPFTFHTDPGHGWLAVTVDDLAALGLTEADFSPYSYRGAAGFRYLEEDCDAPTFRRAWETRHGRKMPYREQHTERASSIRQRPSWGTKS